MIVAVDQLTKLHAVRAVRRTMSFRLAMWAAGSWLLGLALWLICSALEPTVMRAVLEAFAAQNVMWGLLGAGISLALLSQARSADRIATPDASRIARELEARDRLSRVLRFSLFLLAALFLPLGVVVLIIGLARHTPALIGHGLGVLVQGSFLMLFDRAFSSSFQRIA